MKGDAVAHVEEESTTLTIVAPPSSRALILADALEVQTAQRALLGSYVKSQMTVDVDYGVIPGTKTKKTLFKAGAEKLTELYRCAPVFKIMEKTVDFEKGFFHYTFRCQLKQRDSDAVLAEGFGSCNSRESKYRYRSAFRKCPECGAEKIFKSKFADSPGFYCHAKQGGCGANFGANDPRIVGQELGRIENPDIADCLNTVLKMAKKRAHVDAAIAVAGCSDLFTQDVEDQPAEAPPQAPELEPGSDDGPPQAASARPSPVASQPTTPSLDAGALLDWVNHVRTGKTAAERMKLMLDVPPEKRAQVDKYVKESRR